MSETTRPYNDLSLSSVATGEVLIKAWILYYLQPPIDHSAIHLLSSGQVNIVLPFRIHSNYIHIYIYEASDEKH